MLLVFTVLITKSISKLSLLASNAVVVRVRWVLLPAEKPIESVVKAILVSVSPKCIISCSIYIPLPNVAYSANLDVALTARLSEALSPIVISPLKSTSPTNGNPDEFVKLSSIIF